jgi:integrase/recombinase XerD
MKHEKLITEFGEYIIMKGYSERTQESYCYQIEKFFAFLQEHYTRITNVQQINKEILFDYNRFLSCYRDRKDKPLSSKSIKVKLAALKHFFKYLVRVDLILTNPAVSLETPKEEKSLPRVILTEEEVMMILDSINTHHPLGLRNKTILEVLYSCGIRTSELCNLKISDVDLKEQVIFIRHGKGNKSRVVPIGQHCTEYIKQYLEKARKFMLKGKVNDDGYLFLSQRGNKFNRDTINSCVIGTVLKGVLLDKKVTCYTFRHSVATLLIKRGVDIRYVSELLGHSSLHTTQKYCHLEISDLKKMHALYHPREVE